MSSRLVGALAVLLPLAAAGTSLQAQTDTTRTAADSARRVVKLAPTASDRGAADFTPWIAPLRQQARPPPWVR